MYYIELYH